MKAFYESRTYNTQLPLAIRKGNGFDFLAHWHNDIEMLYVCDGYLRIGINTENILLKKGDFAVCSSGDIHYYSSKELFSDFFMLLFKPEILDTKNIWPRDLRFTSPFIESEFLKREGIDERIHRIFTSLHSESMENKEYSIYFQKALLFELCGLVLSHFPSTPITEFKESKAIPALKIMQQALQYLEQNYCNDIHLEDAARFVNLSPFYFSRLFNQVTGLNFKAYINRIRIEKAEEMILSESSKSITNIAYESGFSSIRTFNRAFKAVKGYNPSSIR